MNNIIKSLFVVIIVSVASCAKDKVALIEVPLAPSDCPDTISYNTQVRPIIEQNCSTSGCHDASASGGYQFLTHADVSQYSDVMKKAMKHEPGPSNMPLGLPKLNDTLIQTFECWIMQGTLNN